MRGIALLLVLLLAGCASTSPSAAADRDGDGLSDAREAELGTHPDLADSDGDGVPDGEEVGSGSDPLVAAPTATVVVADIDSGINVYHERFAGTIPDDVLARFVTDTGQAPERVRLNQSGDWESRFEADKPMWEGLKPATLYYFEGTRVLGISFDPGSTYPVLDYPDGSHGTATAGAVFDHNPDAIVVLVEGVGASEGEAWVARQDWIDVVTMSYGPIGSVPLSSVAFGLSTHTQTKSMWAAGMVPVGAADNSPSLAPNDETAGPPWVVGVGGDDPQGFCREHISGTFPDFTADFTQDLPTATSLGNRSTTSGTSFSTPTTAGTFSRVLLEVRKAWGHEGGIVDGALAVSPSGERLTNAGLRDAFNLTAYYFPTGECPGPDPQPVNPAAPWLQMGWGHVGVEIVNATVDHLLGVQEAPDKPEARAFQEGVMAYRRGLWSVIP